MRKPSRLIFFCTAMCLYGCDKAPMPSAQPTDTQAQDVNKKLTNFQSIPLPVPADSQKKAEGK